MPELNRTDYICCHQQSFQSTLFRKHLIIAAGQPEKVWNCSQKKLSLQKLNRNMPTLKLTQKKQIKKTARIPEKILKVATKKFVAPMHIAIAGNIGAGKTTLTSLLAKNMKWEPHFEDADDNPYLNDFYDDM